MRPLPLVAHGAPSDVIELHTVSEPALGIENAPTFLDESNDPEQLAFDLAWIKGFSRPPLLTTGNQSPSLVTSVVAKLAGALPNVETITLPWAGAQPQEPLRLEAALPVIDHVGIKGPQGRDSAGSKADFKPFHDAPAGLLFRRVFTRGPQANQQVLGAQGLLAALRVGSPLERQAERVPRWPWRRGRLMGSLMTARPRLGGEGMLGEHVLNAAVIDRIVLAVPHHPRQFASGKGMSHGQPNDVRLDMPGQEHGRPRLAPRMRQGALINQAQETTTPEALQIPPQPPIVCPSGLALLRQGALAPQDRANGLIAGSGLKIFNGIMDEEGELQRTGRVTGIDSSFSAAIHPGTVGGIPVDPVCCSVRGLLSPNFARLHVQIRGANPRTYQAK